MNRVEALELLTLEDMDEQQHQQTKIWFGQCIEELMTSLYCMAKRLTLNPMDAEDLVAEAVTKAWSKIESLEDRSRFRPWLFRIMHNCFVSHYRKKSVRPQESTYDENDGDDCLQHEVASLLIQQPNEFLNWWANPEKEFISNLLSEEISRAIGDLPEVFQVTVILVNIEGFSYDEAAEILGVSPGTIRSRMNRGRTLLQKALWQHANEAGLISDSSRLECST